jgi:predicted XRE-type DNA-binding protein
MTSIITGDIIASRRTDNITDWLKPLKAALKAFGKEPRHWEIYRGDSFQLEVPGLQDTLYTAIKLRADLQSSAGVHLRMGIGIGEKTYSATKITESNGDAFVRSGDSFDQLQKQTIMFKTPWPELDEEINLYLALALLTIDHWSKQSAEAFQLQLASENITQKEIARKLNITQGRVSERLKRAGSDELLRMLDRYQTLIKRYAP